jgi:hypothetical protein
MIFGKYSDTVPAPLLGSINAPAATFLWHEKRAEGGQQQAERKFHRWGFIVIKHHL